MWLEAFGKVARALIPPADAEPGAVYRYRVAVSLLILGLSMTVIVHIALACGYFAGTVVSFPGFARADAVQDIAKAVASIQLSQLDSKIREDQTSFCKAQDTNNGDAMRETSNRLYRELDNWRELTRREYRLTDCKIMLAK